MSVADVLSRERSYHVAACRAEDLLDSLPDGCVSLVVTDPPYFKVKDEEWDRAWKKPSDFLAWLGGIFDRFRRVLAPNGSLYVFASPQMAWNVEGEARKRFGVLCNIRWQKPPHSTKAEMFRKEDLRSYFPASETIIFAEQFGSDSTALGASGYDAKCDELRGFVFEPIRSYLDAERRRAGVGKDECNEACGFSRCAGGMASRHYFSRSQWCLPTREHYESMRRLFNRGGGEFLRKDYEELREQYESLRRQFAVSSNVPYTDVWTYPTVQRYDGKHVCEKPWQMGLDIVRASSRPGDLVLDCFSGSGCFPAAAVALGRRAISCDMSPEWADTTRDRCQRAIESLETAQSNRKSSAIKQRSSLRSNSATGPTQMTMLDLMKVA